MARVSVKIDTDQLAKDLHSIIKRKVDGAVNDLDVKQQIASKWIELVNPYVPMKSGQLRGNAHVTRLGNIVYTAIDKYGNDYATFQYYGDDSWKRFTPNTHSEWDKFAMYHTGAWDKLCEFTEKLLTEAMQNA